MFLTRPPRQRPKAAPFDLHALGTPPALILSQDQTLHQCFTEMKRRHHSVEQCPRLPAGNRTPRKMWPPKGSCLLRVMATRSSGLLAVCEHPVDRSSCSQQSPPTFRSLRLRHPTVTVAGSRLASALPPRHQLVNVRLPVLEPAEPTVRPFPLSRVGHSVIALCIPSEGTRERTVSGLPGDTPQRIHQLREPHQFTTASLLCQVGCVGPPFAPRLA